MEDEIKNEAIQGHRKVQVKQGQGDLGNFNPSESGPHVRIFGKHRRIIWVLNRDSNS